MRIRKQPAVVGLLLGGAYFIFGMGWVPVALGAPLATNLLEALFAFGAILAMMGGVRSTRASLHAVIIATYIAVCLVFALVVRKENPLDAFLAMKSFWYLLLLMPFASKRYFDAVSIRKLSNFLLYLFFAIYAIKRIVLHIDRPIVLIENNFELILVVLVFYAAFLADRRIRIMDVFLLGTIIALSGSRSSAVVAVVVLSCSVDLKKLRSRDVVLLMGAFIGAVIAFYIFEARSSQDVQSIDRFRFFQQFMYATRRWSVFDYLVGAPRMSPLPPEVCSALSYYTPLFSYSGNGSCYSVILHAFDIRAIYDHGILGLFYMLSCVWFLLSAHERKTKICVLSVLLLTGMSVSSLNNVYVALALAILVAPVKELGGASKSRVDHPASARFRPFFLTPDN